MTSQDVSKILESLPARISDLVARSAARSPAARAVQEAGGEWTYHQLAKIVEENQTWLAKQGIRPGDRVMIVGENCRAFVAMFFATAALDAWPVLANPRLSAREIDEIKDHCGARCVLYTTAVSPQAVAHAKRHNAEIVDAPGIGAIGLSGINDHTTPELVDSDAANRVAALIYTSGTTGQPKGVMLTHRNLLYVAAISARIRTLNPNDRMFGVLPMSHAVGLSVVLLGTLLSGASLFLSPRFDPVATLAALERDQITIMLGVPSMFSLLVEYAKAKKISSLRFPALRIISSSGAPLHAPLKSSVENLFGLTLHNGYGVTECSPTIAQTRVEEPRADTSVGKVFPGTEVRLVANGEQVAPGEMGELWVRGPNVMKGYYRAPHETAEIINAEGWLNTRDLARIDDGNLFIVGRAKELIIRFGFNVYPAELEAVLNSHPNVARSAVIGRAVQGSDGDEEVVAFVEPAKGSSLTPEQLTEYAGHHLAPYKRPSQILLVSSMPLTPTGKVAKDGLAKLMEYSSAAQG